MLMQPDAHTVPQDKHAFVLVLMQPMPIESQQSYIYWCCCLCHLAAG